MFIGDLPVHLLLGISVEISFALLANCVVILASPPDVTTTSLIPQVFILAVEYLEASVSFLQYEFSSQWSLDVLIRLLSVCALRYVFEGHFAFLLHL